MDTEASRLELNLGSPKRPERGLLEPSQLGSVENKLLSPLKLLEQGLYERISRAEAEHFRLNADELLAQMRERFTKPKPLVEKKKIVKWVLSSLLCVVSFDHCSAIANASVPCCSDILEHVLESLHRERTKTKEPVKEWNSPKKCAEV